MADESIQRVISVSQDYLILGKSTKDTEIKIYVDGQDWDSTRKKISNMIRAAAYAEALNEGSQKFPPAAYDVHGNEVAPSTGKPIDPEVKNV